MDTSFSLSTIFLFILLLVEYFLPSRAAAPAIYVFGDSLADSGNNNYLNTAAKAMFPPYGVDFPGGPNGRFTNGKTVIDFIAEKLNLPMPPPYLSLSEEQKSNLTTGVNYASSSCGILQDTGRTLGTCLFLKQQIDYFQRTVEKNLAAQFEEKEKLKNYMRKAIFMLEVGSSDYFNNYLLPNSPLFAKYNPPQFAAFLAQTLSAHIQRIYNLGGRKFVVWGLGAAGCAPYVTNVTQTDGSCVGKVNDMMNEFNKALKPMINQLRSNLQGSVFVQPQVLYFTLNMYHNPSTYGFTFTNIPCCVVGTEGQCIFGKPPCNDRDQHIFYDAFHYTHKAWSIIADECFDKSSSTCSGGQMTIRELADL